MKVTNHLDISLQYAHIVQCSIMLAKQETHFMTSTTNSATDVVSLSQDVWRLWMEASAVIGLRSMRIMQGGKLAEREAKLMLDEKLLANATLGFALLPAIMAAATPAMLASEGLGHYGKRVSANRRRLSRASK